MRSSHAEHSEMVSAAAATRKRRRCLCSSRAEHSEIEYRQPRANGGDACAVELELQIRKIITGTTVADPSKRGSSVLS